MTPPYEPPPPIPEAKDLLGKTPEEIDALIADLKARFRAWALKAYDEAPPEERWRAIGAVSFLVEALDDVACELEDLIEDFKRREEEKGARAT